MISAVQRQVKDDYTSSKQAYQKQVTGLKNSNKALKRRIERCEKKRNSEVEDLNKKYKEVMKARIESCQEFQECQKLVKKLRRENSYLRESDEQISSLNAIISEVHKEMYRNDEVYKQSLGYEKSHYPQELLEIILQRKDTVIAEQRSAKEAALGELEIRAVPVVNPRSPAKSKNANTSNNISECKPAPFEESKSPIDHSFEDPIVLTHVDPEKNKENRSFNLNPEEVDAQFELKKYLPDVEVQPPNPNPEDDLLVSFSKNQKPHPLNPEVIETYEDCQQHFEKMLQMRASELAKE